METFSGVVELVFMLFTSGMPNLWIGMAQSNPEIPGSTLSSFSRLAYISKNHAHLVTDLYCALVLEFSKRFNYWLTSYLVGYRLLHHTIN